MNKIHSGHMEVAVAKLFGYRQNLIVPNVSWGWDLRHEADLIVVNGSNKVTEVEIKISIADLKADFKKIHGHQNKKIHRLFYAFPIEMLEKALPLIPDNCGIITVRTIEPEYDNGIPRYKADYYRYCTFNKLIPPITDNQRLKLSELGCMRIWSLKDILYKK